MVVPRFQFTGRCITGSHSKTANPQVSPHFSLREFTRPDHTYFIHPNLILILQTIRHLLGHAMEITHVDEGEPGFCANIRTTDMPALKQICKNLFDQQHLTKFIEKSHAVFIHAPFSPIDTISTDDALRVAFYVTSAYETSGDPFQQVTGNFDGAGLSFGPIQVNFKSGTLVPLFQRFEKRDPKILQHCFSTHWQEWRSLWNQSIRAQIHWADQRSTGAQKRNFQEPWKTYLKKVGQVPIFRDEMIAFSQDNYGNKAKITLKWLETISPFPITDLRCFCAIFDLCTQQGSLDKAKTQIKAKIQKEKPKRQKQIVQIAVEERARTASTLWQADCMSRRLGILYATPITAQIQGKIVKRDNAYFSLLPEIDIQTLRD